MGGGGFKSREGSSQGATKANVGSFPTVASAEVLRGGSPHPGFPSPTLTVMTMRAVSTVLTRPTRPLSG